LVTFREALGGAARLFLCTALDQLANANDLFSDLLAPFPAARRYADLAQAIRLVCNREPEAQPEFPEFEGGQCPVLYNYFLSAQPNNGQWFSFVIGGDQGTDPRAAIGQVWGPVTEFRLVGREPVVGGDGSIFQGWNIRFFCRGVVGVSQGQLPFEQPQIVEVDTSWITRNASAGVRTLQALLARVDGQPDNCGDPPAEYPPPAPGYNQQQTNITYQNNDGVDVTIPVGFFLAQAFFNANLELEIPVYATINFGVSFPINFNVSTGGISFNFNSGTNNPDGSPTAPPGPPPASAPRPPDFTTQNPPPPPPPEPEFEDEEEEPDPRGRNVIRGAIVTAITVDDGEIGAIFQEGGNPDIRIPDLGHINFKIQVGQSTSWTNDIKVKNERAFIPCPWEGGAVDVSGSPRPGVNWDITAVYAKSSLDIAT